MKMFKMTKKQAVLLVGLALVGGAAQAGVTGAEFQTLYDFVYNAATGYLGRSIAIIGGLIGLGMGAASGKALPAVIGVILAMFGAMGPAIVNSIFNSAIV